MWYEPTGYAAIYTALAKIPLDKASSTLLDYGCGKGRAVIAAATRPFRRIIGIDISERLLAIAQKNLATMRHKRCEYVELLHMDATQYVVPREVNLIYFFHPFIGQVLETVVSNIYASYRQSPREMYYVASIGRKRRKQNVLRSEHKRVMRLRSRQSYLSSLEGNGRERLVLLLDAKALFGFDGLMEHHRSSAGRTSDVR